MARAALEAGKDVFVEKPLSVDLRGGEELVEFAEAKRQILMVGHILRYHPAIVKLQGPDRGRRSRQAPLPVFESSQHRKDPNRGKHPVELRAPRHLGDALAARRDARTVSTARVARTSTGHVSDVTLSQLRFSERRAGAHHL